MAKPKLTQNGEIWTTTVKNCLLGRFCEVMIWKRFYFINLRFLHFLVYATKSKRLPQPLETQNKSIILLFFAFVGVIFPEKLIFPQQCSFLTTAVERKKHGCGKKETYLWWEKLFSSSRLVSGLSGCSLSQVYCQFSLCSASAVPVVQWSMSRYELELVLRARIYIMCPFLSLSQFPLKNML